MKYQNDFSIQNNWGQTALHYCLSKNLPEFFNLMSEKIPEEKKTLIYNLYDTNGNTIFHIILIRDIDIENFGKHLKYVKINAQNNNGNTILHYLVQYNLWKKYIKILQKMKLYIFTQNNKKKSPFDLVKKKDMDIFIEMVTNSYINYLRSKKKSGLKYGIKNVQNLYFQKMQKK